MRKENYEERNNSKGNVNKNDHNNSRSYQQKNKSKGRRKPNQSNQNLKNIERVESESVYNDPAFYNKYPTVLNQVAKVNNYHPVGLMGKDMFGPIAQTIEVRGIPGIAVINMIPAIPVSQSGSSTLQQSAYQTWTKVRDAISGTRSYDPVDLQLMSIAVSQAVACATWIKRFFNFAFTMSPFNRYAPERLFAAMHCDYQDFIKKLPEYRAQYNRITINLSRIYANTENNYHKMIRSVFAGVYAEPGQNGQLYLYSPGGFYKYAWTTDEKGIKVGSLVFQGNNPNDRTKPVGDSVILTMAEILHDYELLVDALITDGDINTMSGDILKTYGAQAQVMLPLALETDSDLPRVSPIDLAQFQMSYVPLNNSKFIDFGTITQTDATYITFAPKLEISAESIPLYNVDNASTEASKEKMKRIASLVFHCTTQRNRILLNDVIDLDQPSNVAEVLRNVPIFADYSLVDFEDMIQARETGDPITIDLWSTTGLLPFSIVSYQIDSYDLIEDAGSTEVLRNYNFLPMRVFWKQITTGEEGSIEDVHLDANVNDYYTLSRDQVCRIQDVMALSMFSDL